MAAIKTRYKATPLFGIRKLKCYVSARTLPSS